MMTEQEIILYNKKYKKITYADGHTELKRYNDKHKIWVVLNFPETNEADDKKLIESFLNSLS
jgi:hypothetical protein